MKNTHEKKHTGVTHLIAVCRALLSLFFFLSCWAASLLILGILKVLPLFFTRAYQICHVRGVFFFASRNSERQKFKILKSMQKFEFCNTRFFVARL